MATRLADGGRLIDRTKPVRFQFNGTACSGFEGDTLASALLANNQVLLGRSFKYHRPRGLVSSGPEEPNALLSVGEGNRFEPNQRATMVELQDGMAAVSQNHWPSLEFDIGSVAGNLSRLLPAGFYYKTFIWPRAGWARLYEPVIRRAAGLGQPPERAGSRQLRALLRSCGCARGRWRRCWTDCGFTAFEVRRAGSCNRAVWPVGRPFFG